MLVGNDWLNFLTVGQIPVPRRSVLKADANPLLANQWLNKIYQALTISEQVWQDLIINYCTLDMKSENEPEISLTVYFKSVKKKGKYVLRKKQTKQNQKKKDRKKNCYGQSRTPDFRYNVLPIAPRQPAKNVLFTSFPLEILPLDAVWSQ